MGTYEISRETAADLMILSEPVAETHLLGLTYEDFIGCGHSALIGAEIQLADPGYTSFAEDTFSLRTELTA